MSVTHSTRQPQSYTQTNIFSMSISKRISLASLAHLTITEWRRFLVSRQVRGSGHHVSGVITGGDTSACTDEFPWAAMIGSKSIESKDIQWKCGGSLITNQHVLTAAHCVIAIPTNIAYSETTLVRLGALNLNEMVKNGSQPRDIPVENIIWHEQFSVLKRKNDIAIIKMTKKVEFSSYIRPICLTPEEIAIKNITGFKPNVAGWGTTKRNQPSKFTQLMVGDVEIKETNECRKNLTSVPALANFIIDSWVLCASSDGVDSCQGDSGGPLMMARRLKDSSTVNYFQIGVVAYGYSCGRQNYPGVYTRVSMFMQWIHENLLII